MTKTSFSIAGGLALLPSICQTNYYYQTIATIGIEMGLAWQTRADREMTSFIKRFWCDWNMQRHTLHLSIIKTRCRTGRGSVLTRSRLGTQCGLPSRRSAISRPQPIPMEHKGIQANQSWAAAQRCGKTAHVHPVCLICTSNIPKINPAPPTLELLTHFIRKSHLFIYFWITFLMPVSPPAKSKQWWPSTR